MWAQCVINEQSSYVGRRNNISTEKSIQELKGEMRVSPLVQLQQRRAKTASNTYVCRRSQGNFCDCRDLCG